MIMAFRDIGGEGETGAPVRLMVSRMSCHGNG